jgi:SAM-dependent methyltransferase
MAAGMERDEDAALDVSGQRARAIRLAAENHWSRDPAGSVALYENELGTPQSFAKIERHRYADQPWMHEAFAFEQFAGQRVLEIGVGLGTDHLQFARAGAKMTGIDLTRRCVELTRRRFEQEGLCSDLRIMDAERLEFPDSSFDVVYSFGVLHHVPSPEAAFSEVRRVLRPDGIFLGAVYNRWSVVTAAITGEWLASGGWRREGLQARIARIEHSVTSSVPGPYVRLFGAHELRGALESAGFHEVSLVRRHFGLRKLGRRLPAPVIGVAGSLAGWYLVYRAQ